MPCWTRQTSVVEFGENTDTKLLINGLKALGYSVNESAGTVYFSKEVDQVNGNYRAGKLTLRTGAGQQIEKVTNQFKQAYSAEVVQATAKRFGWQVKQTEQFKFQVVRRS